MSTTKVKPIKESQITRGEFYNTTATKFCALGWCDEQLPDSKNRSIFRKTYIQIGQESSQKIYECDVTKIHDDILRYNADRKALINATLRQMGYNILVKDTVGKTILKDGWKRKKDF
jgi:hypothetical protein